MKSIYNCRHIFVLYRGGSGGNWISRMLENLLTGTFADIELTASGSSHSIMDCKRLGVDHLSFGIQPTETKKKHHDPQREHSYLEKINAMSISDRVVWSHDYSNLRLYRKYFPNSVKVSIMVKSIDQRLSTLFMRINKMDFDPYSIKPYSQEQDLKARFVSGLMIKQGLLDHGLKESTVQYLVNSQDFKEIKLYSSIYSYLNYYGLQGYLNSTHQVNDRSVRMLYPRQESVDFIEKNFVFCPYSIKLSKERSLNSRWDQLIDCGQLLDSYLDNDVQCLDYRVIIHSRTEELIKMFSQVLLRSLESREISYIETQFRKYMSRQNLMILQDPRQYYHELKHKFFSEISQLL